MSLFGEIAAAASNAKADLLGKNIVAWMITSNMQDYDLSAIYNQSVVRDVLPPKFAGKPAYHISSWESWPNASDLKKLQAGGSVTRPKMVCAWTPNKGALIDIADAIDAEYGLILCKKVAKGVHLPTLIQKLYPLVSKGIKSQLEDALDEFGYQDEILMPGVDWTKNTAVGVVLDYHIDFRLNAENLQNLIGKL